MNHTLKADLLRLIEHPHYQPRSKAELARDLGLDSRQRAELRALVDELEEAGILVCMAKGKYAVKRLPENLVPGMVRILRSGKALFLPKIGDPTPKKLGWDTALLPELELKPNRLGGALDGDRVLARIDRKIPKSRRGGRKPPPSGLAEDWKIRIEKVTERARSRWMGIFRTGKTRKGRVLGDGVGAPAYIELTELSALEVLPGQLVSVEPVTYGGDKQSPTGRIIEVLGYPDDPHVDVESVIRKYDLATEFPPAVTAEADALPESPTQAELARRQNCTGTSVITIDPATAKDFDDAISVRKIPNGWVLDVHIADVSHYVKQGGSLDAEARRRGNSTYLPDRVLPMLPPRLSDDLCSLRPGVIRLTKLCSIVFNRRGKMLKTDFSDAFICSKARLSYEEAFQMIQGKGVGEVPDMVRTAWELASILRRNRYEKGALDLDFPEVRVIPDENGRPIDIITEEYDESHQLIEEFMLAANEAVAIELQQKNRPAIYRVHEEPDAGKLFEFANLCRLYGHDVHDLSQRQYLNKLMDSIKGSPDEQLLKLSLLKSLMRARYDTDPLGHYGLATVNYCHFTSPIRRYADLVVHRALNPLLKNPPTNGKNGAGNIAELAEAAEHISITERNSAAAEKDAHRMKLFEWLEAQCYAETPKTHEALITDARHFGLLLELPKLQIKGLIKPDQLPAGRWWYEAFATRWTCNNGTMLYPGMRIKVIPAHVNRDEQWADFTMIEE